MTIERIGSLMTAAEQFAHNYHADKKFTGYTETEITKGIAFSIVMLGEIISARDENRDPLSHELIDHVKEAVGITSLEIESRNRALEVTEIAISFIPTRKSEVAN